ncbi:hypothetical protein FF100_36640 [Methylobacterium terricola]|uniref:Uncharacterized protein n=1 Tax=Methylobacterium terricola TaxID=2583531 RepID=A0A5C4L7D3_9HYPH|nr:hypothetical protein [Methylobacterium terricola]TNC04335.1 hypothetical protein FF100_36640 [Methylobacterium terricola]
MNTLPPLVLEWSRGLATLSPAKIPCPNFEPDEWRGTHTRCTEFVTLHGARALEYGCDAVSLFGVSPKDGIIRGDWTGVLMPFRAEFVEMTREYSAFGKVRAFKDQPIRYRGVPVWEFKP